jgi:hypothetical protein
MSHSVLLNVTVKGKYGNCRQINIEKDLFEAISKIVDHAQEQGVSRRKR